MFTALAAAAAAAAATLSLLALVIIFVFVRRCSSLRNTVVGASLRLGLLRERNYTGYVGGQVEF